MSQFKFAKKILQSKELSNVSELDKTAQYTMVIKIAIWIKNTAAL